MYKIDKGLAWKQRKYSDYKKYPFKDMDIGDSFFFSDAPRTRIAVSASSYGKFCGKLFTIRREAEGYRCIRLK